MENVELVETLEPHGDLDQHPPDVVLLELCGRFLMMHYLLVEVAVVRKLHHDAA